MPAQGLSVRYGMDTAALKAGERVALIGCGFMGLIFAQLLAKSPVARLAALDVDKARLRLACGFGLAETHNTRGSPNTAA